MTHRELIKDMMDLAVNITQDWYKKSAKVEVGMMVGIHTFGDTVNFSPHVHMLVTEGGLTNDNKMKRFEFIPYVMLRKRWQAGILSLLRKSLTEEKRKSIEI